MIRARIFDILILAIPLLTLLSAMPLTIALVVLTVVILTWEVLGVFCIGVAAHGTARAIRSMISALLLWAILSAIWSVSPAESLVAVMRIIMLCALGGLAALYIHKLRPPSTRMVQLYLISFAVCAGLLALEQLPHGAVIEFISSSIGGDYDRYMRKTVNRGLCAFTVLVWPAMYLLYRMQRPALAWGLLGLVAIPVIAMQSLSAQLGLVVGIATFFFCRFGKAFGAKTLIIIVPILFVSLPFITSWMLHAPLLAPYIPALTEMSAGRLPIWNSLLSQSAFKPILGWGMDMAQSVPMAPDIMAAIGLKEPPLHPHHSALHVKLELGLVGLVIAALMLRQILSRITAHTQAEYAPLALACATSYLGAGFSSFGVWQNWWVATAWICVLLWKRFSAYSPR